MIKLILFLILAQAIFTKADVIPQSYTFEGVNRFFDISQFNFYRGLDNVYEYTFTSTNTNKIYLYFYTLPTNNAVVEMFNGKDDKAPVITLGFLPDYYNDTYSYPLVADSSGPNMFVRITPQNPSVVPNPDFQGLVTDFANPDSALCDPLVFQVNKPNVIIDSIPFSIRKNQPCNHIIHALDITNNPLLTLNLNLKNSVEMKLVSFYKGLLSIEDNRLTSMPNVFAFDKHILIQHSTDLNLTSSVTVGSNMQRYVVGDNGVGMLMSQDYLPYSPNYLTEQYIDDKFEIDFSGNVSTVEIVFPQAEFSNANVTVQIWNGNTPDITTYTKTPPTITAYGRAVVIDYQCLQGWGRGLYATFRDVSYQYPLRTPALRSPIETTTTKATTNLSLWTTMIAVYIIILLHL